MTISIILGRPRTSSVATEDIERVLFAVNQTVSQCQTRINEFADSHNFIRMLRAKSYKSDFKELHERLLRVTNDLQLAWLGDVQDRVMDMQDVLAHMKDIQTSLLSRFEAEAMDMLLSLQNIEAMLALNREEQASLVAQVGSVGQGLGQVMAAIDEIKAQLEAAKKSSGGNGAHMAVLQTAPQRIRMALGDAAALPEQLKPAHLRLWLDRVLGRGSFGEVYEAELIGRGAVAAKVICEREADGEVLREAGALYRLVACREVLCLHGWLRMVPHPTRPGETAIVLVTELCVRSLAAAIKDWTTQPQPTLVVWLRYLQDTAGGMAFLVQHGIYHRDLKPENVLIKQDGHAVVSDFGLAMTRSTVQRASKVAGGGTVGYMAPETAEGLVSELTEAYAFGTTAAHTLLRQFPWVDSRGNAMTAQQIYRAQDQGLLPRNLPTAERFPQLPPSLLELLRSCLSPEPALRPSFVQLHFALYQAVADLTTAGKQELHATAASVAAQPVELSHDTTASTVLGSPPVQSTSQGAASPLPVSRQQLNYEESPEDELAARIRALIVEQFGFDHLHSKQEVQAELAAKQQELAQMVVDERNNVKPRAAVVQARQRRAQDLQQLLAAIEELETQQAAQQQLAEAIHELIAEEFGLQGMSCEHDVVDALAAKQVDLEQAKTSGKSKVIVDRLQDEVQLLQSALAEIAALRAPPQDHQSTAAATREAEVRSVTQSGMLLCRYCCCCVVVKGRVATFTRCAKIDLYWCIQRLHRSLQLLSFLLSSC